MKGWPVERAQEFVRVCLRDVLSPWMGMGVSLWHVLKAWMLVFKQGLSLRAALCQADLYSRGSGCRIQSGFVVWGCYVSRHSPESIILSFIWINCILALSWGFSLCSELWCPNFWLSVFSIESSPLCALSEVRLFISLICKRFGVGSWAWEHGFRSSQVTFSSMEAVI